MSTVTQSLWLPVSRANFYNSTEYDWLDLQASGDTAKCSSTRIRDSKYVPLILVGVLRRLLEVLPRSFGYAEQGRCRLRGDSASRKRPVDVTMTLDLSANTASGPRNFWHEANDELVAAKARKVELFVDENGWYAFTATYDVDADPQRVRSALIRHIREVFGGNYVVHPLPAEGTKKVDVGGRSLKEYNGLTDRDAATADADGEDAGHDDTRVSQPRGALAFSQLNILAEGLWNDTLSPAVYLEQREFMEHYLQSEESTDFLRSVADVIQALTTDSDARRTVGQIVVLHHFLSITSGGSLMKLKAALDSCRRRLLNEMISNLHRQSRLVQLQFSSLGRERRPELAVSATEAQLRGYAAVVAAKFPLFLSVKEMIRLAKDHLDWLVRRGGPIAAEPWELEEAKFQLTRLDGQVVHWNALISDLEKNVDGMGRTIERAWQDELLYEQKQARSDQEAMAEMERSRLSRPMSSVAGKAAYSLITIVLALLGVVFTARSEDLSRIGQPGTTAWQIFLLLWPVWAALIISGLILPVIVSLWRARNERLGRQGTYPYEFSFRLDEPVDARKLRDHVGATKRRPVARHGAARRALNKVWANNRGYGRIERISPDTTVLKVHTVVTFRASLLHFARFEVINEILIHKIGTRTQRTLVQSRTFGESPEPLTDVQLVELLRIILGDVLNEIAVDVNKTEVDTLISELLPEPDAPPTDARTALSDAADVPRPREELTRISG